tara:strand:+ start:1178 stop:1492 length:315 start_codon:yes stop_codon:yes gene_type:complete
MPKLKDMLPLQKGDLLYIKSIITDDDKPFVATVLDYKADHTASRPFPVIDGRYKHKNKGKDMGFRRRKVVEHVITALHNGKPITIRECISHLTHIDVIRPDESE